MKKAFQRTCMACNNKTNKYNLIRIVRTPEGKPIIDNTGKIEGRGAYICSNEKCLNKVIKTERISRTLKIKIDKNFYENIRGVIIDSEKTKQEKSKK